jgi:hypothetical protein
MRSHCEILCLVIVWNKCACVYAIHSHLAAYFSAPETLVFEKTSIPKVQWVAWLGCLLSLPALAQKAELFGGYQLTHFDGGSTSNGWNAAVTGNVFPFLGLTADFSGVYDSGTHFYTYTFGPEVHARALGVKPFAHALFGGGTFSAGGTSSTGFTTGAIFNVTVPATIIKSL